MQLGLIGLGRMGANMVERLLAGGHQIVAFDRNPAVTQQVAAGGARAASSLQDLVSQLTPPRAIWMMVPAGAPVAQTIDGLLPHLARGDILIDGGNSNYNDSMARAAQVASRGVKYIDAGTSGGIWGLTFGYCLMVGGDREAVERVEPIFRTLAPEGGFAHVGPVGAGHYAKMVHNGIEYALLQAYGEGFEILHAAPFRYNLQQLAELWNHGSVVRSWLLELAERAFAQDAELASIADYVEDSGEGRWTILEAIERSVPAPAITLALLERFRSRQAASFSAKVIAALRNQFGGHAVKPT